MREFVGDDVEIVFALVRQRRELMLIYQRWARYNLYVYGKNQTTTMRNGALYLTDGATSDITPNENCRYSALGTPEKIWRFFADYNCGMHFWIYSV